MNCVGADRLPFPEDELRTKLGSEMAQFQTNRALAINGDQAAYTKAMEGSARISDFCAALGMDFATCVGPDFNTDLTAAGVQVDPGFAAVGTQIAGTPDAATGGGASQEELKRRGGILAQAYVDAVVRALRTGDLATERPIADKALADLKQVCSALGVPELGTCVGDLPEFPQTSPTALNPDASSGGGVQVEPLPAPPPLRLADLKDKVDYYNTNLGDPSFGRSETLGQIAALCKAGGYDSIDQCLIVAELGIRTEPSPEQARVPDIKFLVDYYNLNLGEPLFGDRETLGQITARCQALHWDTLGRCLEVAGLSLKASPSGGTGELGTVTSPVGGDGKQPGTVVAGTIDENGNLAQQVRYCDAAGSCFETTEVPEKAAELGRIATLVDQHNASINDPNFDRDLAFRDLGDLCAQTGLGDLLACVAQTGRTLWPKPTATQVAGGAGTPQAGTGALTPNESAEVLRRVAVLVDDYNARVNDPSFDPALAKVTLGELCAQSGLGDLEICVERTGRSLAVPAAPTAGAPGQTDNYPLLIQNAVAAYNANVPTRVDSNFDRRETVFKIAFLCGNAGFSDSSTCLDRLGLSLNEASHEQKLLESVNAYTAAVADLNAGDASGEQRMDAERAIIRTECQALGHADLAPCLEAVGAALPPTPRNKVGAATATVVALSDEERDRLLRITRIAPQGYLDAINGPDLGGDDAATRDIALTHLADLKDACAKLGTPELADCIPGVVLPPFPEPGTQPAGGAHSGSSGITAADAKAYIRTFVDDYNRHIAEAKQYGDFEDARVKLPFVLQQLAQVCSILGTPNPDQCLAQQGYPPLEPLPANSVATAGSPTVARNAITDAYNAYVAAQASGDATATETAQAGLTNECIIAGYPTFGDCVAALSAATVGAANPPDPLAAAEAGIRSAVNLYSQGATKLFARDASGQADVDAATAALQQNCAPLGFASNKECAANYGLTLPPLPATTTNAGNLTAEERLAQQGAASNAYAAYINATEEAASGDYDTASRKAKEAQRALQDACFALGVTVNECIGGDLPEFPAPAGSAGDRVTDAKASIKSLVDEYNLHIADAKQYGDFEDARVKLPFVLQQLAQVCGVIGTPNLDQCIAEQGYPPLEQLPALDGRTASLAAREDLARARNGYEVGNAAMLALVRSGGPVSDTSEGQVQIARAINQITARCNIIAGSELINLASPMSALDDCLTANGLPALSTPWHLLVPTLPPEVLANLQMMVGDYNALAQSTAPFDKDGLQKTIGDYCAANGLGDLKSCLGTAGLLLADQSVTTATMEKLPDGTTPTNAAPLLDSAKGGTAGPTILPAGGGTKGAATPTTLATLTTVAAPKTDAEAQANLPKVALPATFESGKPVDASTVRFTPPKSLPAETKGNGQAGTGTSINLSATITPEGGFLFNLGAQLVISNPEQERKRLFDPNKDLVGYEKLADDRIRETVTRPSGKKLITIRNTTGEVAQREIVMPGGRSFTLAAGTGSGLPDFQGGGLWRDPGDDLPPLRLSIPADDYVLDADEVEADDVEFFLVQPPVERVARVYSLEEVKRSARIRDSVRRLEIGDLTFESGESTLPRNQVGSLQEIADAMLELLDRNPAETFLIEGHTDAVGDDTSNLALSDDRALEVARILSEDYDVPPENLATQGYGETFLKVKTEKSEPANRRVTIRRITPLITVASAR